RLSDQVLAGAWLAPSLLRIDPDRALDAAEGVRHLRAAGRARFVRPQGNDQRQAAGRGRQVRACIKATDQRSPPPRTPSPDAAPDPRSPVDDRRRASPRGRRRSRQRALTAPAIDSKHAAYRLTALFGAVAKLVRQGTANPSFSGSNP